MNGKKYMTLVDVDYECFKLSYLWSCPIRVELRLIRPVAFFVKVAVHVAAVDH